MTIVPSERLSSIGAYAFAEVDRQVEEFKKKGIHPIDFGVGDPTIPTPAFIREACKKAIDLRATSGYPSYIGSREFRTAVAGWMKKRFAVDYNPDSEIASTIGSKEAVFNIAEGFVNPGEVVLVPSPGYPPYQRGTLFAEGKSYFIPLLKQNDYLLDLDSIPNPIRKKAKILWLNYPNSPTGKIAPPQYLKKVIEFCHKHGIIILSDEAYTEIYFKEKPHSILEYTRDGVAAIFSLSKRSAMTGYRVGWIAGDKQLISIFKKIKTNIDSGTPTFIQDAAIAALSDESHVEEMRKSYEQKRDILVKSLIKAGLSDCTPEATLYLWQKVPNGYTSLEFAKKLLSPDIAIVTTPGSWLGDENRQLKNAGEGYVRFALVPDLASTQLAANRIQNIKF